MSVVADFSDFIYESNAGNSGKANSYVHALDSVNLVLAADLVPGFEKANVYELDDVALQKIRRYLLDHGQTPGNHLLAAVPKAPSHLLNRFCSAAIAKLCEFRNNEMVDAQAIETCRAAKTPKSVAEAIAKTKVTPRTFRKYVLENYNNACCLTGLDIRETLKAAVIYPEAPGNAALAPDNALCLSATYAEAFRAHLITFDEKLRLVLSKSLKDHTTSAIFDSTFKTYENTCIRRARFFQPNECYLAEHRELLVG